MDPFFEKQFITTKDAGELSGYSSDYLARLVRLGKITGKRFGHSWLIDSNSLLQFLETQKNRKASYLRVLARIRGAEYLLHQNVRKEQSNRTFVHRVTKVLSKSHGTT